MNYIVLRPAGEAFALLVYVHQNEFKYCNTDFPDFTRHVGDIHDFVSRASSRAHAIVISTTASTIDEVRSLYPELLI